jgi:hypothetical protein
MKFLTYVWLTLFCVDVALDCVLPIILWAPIDQISIVQITSLRTLKLPVFLYSLLFSAVCYLNYHYSKKLSRESRTESDFAAGRIYSLLALVFYPVGTLIGSLSLIVLGNHQIHSRKSP